MDSKPLIKPTSISSESEDRDVPSAEIEQGEKAKEEVEKPLGKWAKAKKIL